MTYKQQSNVNCEYRTLHNRELQLLSCQNQNYRKTHTSHLYPVSAICYSSFSGDSASNSSRASTSVNSGENTQKTNVW